MINNIILNVFNEIQGDIQRDRRKLHKTPERTKDYIPDVNIKNEFKKAHPALHSTIGTDEKKMRLGKNLEKMQGGFRGEQT